LPASRRGEFAVAAGKSPDVDLGCLASFDCRGDGREVSEFFARGRLTGRDRTVEHEKGTLHGAALCATTTLQPGQTRKITMGLGWDFPDIQIYEPGGRLFKRKYNEYRECEEIDAMQFAKACIVNGETWSGAIDTWHAEVRASVSRDPVLLRAVLNEQYYLLDGGTLWEAETNNFGMLESIDYFNYETLDVRFYYSFTTLRYWPKIENRVLDLFADGILREDTRMVPWKYGYDYGCQRPEDIPGWCHGSTAMTTGASARRTSKRISGLYAGPVRTTSAGHPVFPLRIRPRRKTRSCSSMPTRTGTSISGKTSTPSSS
jgi:uncharacterized protein (DUF608 family)